MLNKKSNWTYAAATVATLVAGAACLPASAASQYGASQHRSHHRAYSSDVTVKKSAPREPVAVYSDAFHGPAALITGPVYVAGTFVSLPFRALEVVFPPHANDPRFLVGGPVHFVGQVATFPFTTVNSAFGVRSTPYNYN